jgi:hypothetical protein
MANKPFKKRPVLGPPPTRAADGGIVLSEVLGAVGPSVRFFRGQRAASGHQSYGNGRSRVVLPSNETAAETSIRLTPPGCPSMAALQVHSEREPSGGIVERRNDCPSKRGRVMRTSKRTTADLESEGVGSGDGTIRRRRAMDIRIAP